MRKRLKNLIGRVVEVGPAARITDLIPADITEDEARASADDALEALQDGDLARAAAAAAVSAEAYSRLVVRH